MNQEFKEYFGRIIRLETPKQIQGQYSESYEEMCAFYCRIRNTARDVLLSQNLNLEIAKRTIEEILKKIEKLSKETIFERDKKGALV